MKRAFLTLTMLLASITLVAAQQFQPVQADEAPMFVSVDLLAKCTKRFLDGDANPLIEATRRGEAIIVPKGALCSVSVTPEGFVAVDLKDGGGRWYTYKSVFGL